MRKLLIISVLLFTFTGISQAKNLRHLHSLELRAVIHYAHLSANGNPVQVYRCDARGYREYCHILWTLLLHPSGAIYGYVYTNVFALQDGWNGYKMRYIPGSISLRQQGPTIVTAIIPTSQPELVQPISQ